MSRHKRRRTTDAMPKVIAEAMRYDRAMLDAAATTHCRCGKVKHPSRKSAKRHLRGVRRADYQGEVYRCPLTGAWHVGWKQSDRGLLTLDTFYIALMELAGLPLRRGFAREKVNLPIQNKGVES